MSALAKTAVAFLLSFTAATWHPGGGDFKCFEDYRCITDTSSPQWVLQKEATTDENGLRKIDGAYCVALGSAFGSEIGSTYVITLSGGSEFLAILADQKADQDTIGDHTRDRSGAVVEFVVETEKLPGEVRASGDVSALPEFAGSVVKIRRME